MAYKTTEEMICAFQELIAYFSEEKGAFPVHQDYLIDGMAEKEFNQGYEEYRKLLLALQNDICDKPAEYGLVKTDKNGYPKPACTNNYPYLWLFLALSQAGEVKGDVLYVDGKKFAEFVKGKAVGSHTGKPENVGALLSMLAGYGVFIKGHDADTENDFTVSSDKPRMMSAIKASTLSQYAKKSMMSDYVTFNENLYSIGMKEQIKFENTHTYKLLPVDLQKFSIELIKELAKIGWKSYVERHHEPGAGRLTYPTIEYYFNADPNAWTRHGSSWIFLRVNDVVKHLDYINQLPENHHDVWRNAFKCRGCTKGECSGRYIGTVLGKKVVWCNGGKATFPCDIENIPYIVEIARVMAKK